MVEQELRHPLPELQHSMQAGAAGLLLRVHRGLVAVASAVLAGLVVLQMVALELQTQEAAEVELVKMLEFRETAAMEDLVL
jgi:hypothetical protein